MEARKEMDDLKSIVNEVFDIDIMNKRGTRTLVDARKVFAKILADRGFGISEIGKYLKKHHSTILHYNNDVDGLLMYKPSVREKYSVIKTEFLKIAIKIDKYNSDAELETEIFRLKNKIDELTLNNNKYRRLENIIKLIDSRTPTGKESFVLKKINSMFNGITDYEQELE